MMTCIVGRHCENTPALPHLSLSRSRLLQQQRLHVQTWTTQIQKNFLKDICAMKTAQAKTLYKQKEPRKFKVTANMYHNLNVILDAPLPKVPSVQDTIPCALELNSQNYFCLCTFFLCKKEKSS